MNCERNNQMNTYPMYPVYGGYMPNMMPSIMPNSMMINPNSNNTSILENRIANLENRVSRLENIINNGRNQNYSDNVYMV